MAPARTESPRNTREVTPRVTEPGSAASRAELPALPGWDRVSWSCHHPQLRSGVTRGPKSRSEGAAVLPARPKLVALRWVIPATGMPLSL